MALGRIKQVKDVVKEMRIAGYIRVSTQDQADSGLGLEVQIERIKAMATVKGWNSPVIYTDAGVSGTVEPLKRNGMSMLLNDVALGNIDAVIVLSLDRLGRTSKIVTDLVAAFEDKGVVFISTKESFDSSTASGKFVMQMFASVAELERNIISERVKGALKVRKDTYGYSSGQLPMGYIRIVEGNNESIGINEVEAVIVQKIYNLKRSGKYSLRAIAAKLDMKCGPSTIKCILDNVDYYKGKVAHFPKVI